MLEQPVPTQQAASQPKDGSQQPQPKVQTEGSRAVEGHGGDGHISGIADMPKTMATGSEVQ